MSQSVLASMETDLPPGSVPTELVQKLALMKKQLLAQEEQLVQKEKDKEALAKEKEALAKRVAEQDARDAAAREEFAKIAKPGADEVIALMEEVAKEEGLTGLSDDFKSVTTSMMTDPSPLGRQMQAAQIACARKIKKQAGEIVALRAKYTELESAARVTTEMAHVADSEAERSERRDLKAARRATGSGLMQDDTVEDTASRPLSTRPSWVQQFQGINTATSYVLPVHRAAPAPVPEARTVTAGRNTAPAAPARAVPGGNDMASLNPEFWRLLTENTQHAPIDRGANFHLAGKRLAVAPGGI
jgi:hypothetical protein